jgi:hypothetical protein
MSIDDVDIMALEDGKVEIIGIPPVMLMDGLGGSATLDGTLRPEIV